MSRDADYQFVEVDARKLAAAMIADYEKETDTTVRPASPERLFISWMANIILQERAVLNRAANQNLPSRAVGSNLDALAELFYLQKRPQATPATCTMRFYISEPQDTSILIPEGTRVTDAGGNLYWETLEDVYVPIGNEYVDTQVRCQVEGAVGNGWALGQINTLVDVYDYYTACANITESANGSDVASDDEFYDLLRSSQDAYSVAGPEGAYIYHVMASNMNIADVQVTSPTPGCVNIYILMEDGTIANDEVKSAAAAALSDDVRPLTDFVTVADPGEVTYNIDFTYYIPRNTAMSAAEVETVVQEAVDEYITWQSAALGRDINPSYLSYLLMQTGIKRVEIREPVFTVLESGGGTAAPEIAKLNSLHVVNGGYEDE